MLSGEPLSRRRQRAATIVLCLGLGVTVLGTFLPWLRSGRTARNSYASAAELRWLLQPGGIADAALRLWTCTAIVGALAMVLVVVGRTLLGAALALVPALASGAVAVLVLSAVSHGSVRADPTGPGWTVAGAAVSFAAALCCFTLSRHVPRRPR